ncbi:hypothetical protein V8F33_002860 [Rhypophila sp. PSN 637]
MRRHWEGQRTFIFLVHRILAASQLFAISPINSVPGLCCKVQVVRRVGSGCEVLSCMSVGNRNGQLEIRLDRSAVRRRRGGAHWTVLDAPQFRPPEPCLASVRTTADRTGTGLHQIRFGSAGNNRITFGKHRRFNCLKKCHNESLPIKQNNETERGFTTPNTKQ